MPKFMQDIQSLNDNRDLPLEFVGIKKLALPLYIAGKNGKHQQVNSLINFYTGLSSKSRGTHMSRFVEALYENRDNHLTFERLSGIAHEIKKKLKAKNAYLEISFTYFIKKMSPISKKHSLANYECTMMSEVNCENHVRKLIVRVPVMLLCPCSKAISKFNAHNQRALVTLEADLVGNLWIEDLVTLVEKEGSSEIYPLLKRPDEKFVTEESYNNPKFVEDIVRDIALKLKGNSKIQSFSVECESYESVHNHNAYAKISSNHILKGGYHAGL